MGPTLNWWWPMTKTGKLFLMLLLAVALGAGCKRGSYSSKPPIHPNPNMDSQEKYKPQAEAPFFKNNASMRTPVAGTVARGTLKQDATEPYQSVRLGFTVPVDQLGAFYSGRLPSEDYADNPIPATKAIIKRGQQRFNIYCAPCHDYAGYGQGTVAKRGGLMVPSYHTEVGRDRKDGFIYEMITKGSLSGIMQPYNDQIDVEDRWAIVHYVRALQRSQNPEAGDLAAAPAAE